MDCKPGNKISNNHTLVRTQNFPHPKYSRFLSAFRECFYLHCFLSHCLQKLSLHRQVHIMIFTSFQLVGRPAFPHLQSGAQDVFCEGRPCVWMYESAVYFHGISVDLVIRESERGNLWTINIGIWIFVRRWFFEASVGPSES